jgi:hypothetical protein
MSFKPRVLRFGMIAKVGQRTLTDKSDRSGPAEMGRKGADLPKSLARQAIVVMRSTLF